MAGTGPSSAIRAVGLSKRYGDTLALDLVVEPGEVYGYLGPNGAGRRPRSGSCSASIRLFERRDLTEA